MSDSKSYLIRAINEWINDNSLTPYLYVKTNCQGLVIPEHLLENNPLILNISPCACQELHLGNAEITFQARFNGRVFDIYLPIKSIIAIIASENGQGMTFEVNADNEQATNSDKNDLSAELEKPSGAKKNWLKVIK